ncbi:MAG: hypothetical protein ACXVA9_13180 [Bdellovibrionales bacterium]
MRATFFLILTVIWGALAHAEISHQCQDIKLLNPSSPKKALIAMPASRITINDDNSATVALEGKEYSRTAQEATDAGTVPAKVVALMMSSIGKPVTADQIVSTRIWNLLPGDGKSEPGGDTMSYAEVRLKTGETKVLVQIHWASGTCSIPKLVQR